MNGLLGHDDVIGVSPDQVVVLSVFVGDQPSVAQGKDVLMGAGRFVLLSAIHFRCIPIESLLVPFVDTKTTPAGLRRPGSS